MIVVQIAGRLGKDAETRFTSSGQKVSTLTLATNVRKAGKEETVWWKVTIWGDRFDKLIPYLKKGSALIVTGEMNKPEIWTDKEGKPQVSLEIVAEIIRFSPSGERSNQDAAPSGQTQAHQASNGADGRSDFVSSGAGYKGYADTGYQSSPQAQSASSGYQRPDPEDSIPF